MGTFSYIKNYLKDRDVASVTPSSKYLVRRVCKRMDFSQPRVIVEYGPGEGVFSRYIWNRMAAGSRLFLIETNADFIRKLREEAPEEGVEVVQDTAEHIEKILKAREIEGADYILSGIPFSFFDEEDRNNLVEATHQVLHPNGKFLVYQHYNHMQEPLERHFERVEADFELLNIPPIHIHAAIKSL